MTHKIDSSSFDIGEAFENYIQNVIFIQDKYDLIHRTHNFKQNSERFPEESKKPDFKFRCKKSKREFYVEAKFRSKFNNDDKLHILDLGQYNRYKEINNSESPVFMAIGYEGNASNPRAVSLIRLDKMEYLDLYPSVLKKYEIAKKPYDNDLLNLIISEEFTQKEIKQPKKVEQIFNIELPKRKNSKIIIGFFLLALLVSTILFLFFSQNKTIISKNTPIVFEQKIKSNVEQNLKNNIKKYYEAFENNNMEVLDYFINNKVDRWYNESNVNLTFIKNEAQKYVVKYPYRNIKIQWETFKYNELPNGDYSVSYNLVYKIKSNIESDYKKYDLNIKAIWGHNLKIKSMYEDRLK